jgi:hypothetical protein
MAGTGGKRKGAGRPKGGLDKARKDFIDLISDKDVGECIAVLKKVLRNGQNEKLKLDAATYILDQKFGKARQRTDLNIENGIEIRINDFTDETNI